jgi:hypothetical protein
MAALALIAGTSIAVGRAMPVLSQTQDEPLGRPQPADPSQPRSPTVDSRPRASHKQTVLLNLEIAGLGRDGCDVEVKPGNASCRFRAVKVTSDRGKGVQASEGAQHVSSEGHASLELKDVELRGADRICTVAITVRERGQAPKTVYRGFRLAARPEAGVAPANGPVPSFTCYLSSASKAAPATATADQSRSRK